MIGPPRLSQSSDLFIYGRIIHSQYRSNDDGTKSQNGRSSLLYSATVMARYSIPERSWARHYIRASWFPAYINSAHSRLEYPSGLPLRAHRPYQPLLYCPPSPPARENPVNRKRLVTEPRRMNTGPVASHPEPEPTGRYSTVPAPTEPTHNRLVAEHRRMNTVAVACHPEPDPTGSYSTALEPEATASAPTESTAPAITDDTNPTNPGRSRRDRRL